MLQRTIHELQVLFPDTHVPLCTHVPLSLTSPYHSRPQNTLTSLRHSRPLIHSRPINAPPLSHSPCHPHPTSGPPARPQYPAAQPGPCTPPALYPPLLLTPPPRHLDAVRNPRSAPPARPRARSKSGPHHPSPLRDDEAPTQLGARHHGVPPARSRVGRVPLGGAGLV